MGDTELEYLKIWIKSRYKDIDMEQAKKIKIAST